ncbi:unnamed protein product [Colias eurytheme]|nr:unnamed protein product [Colias eurytheme]
MDAQTAINKLVENLSFQVLTGPCKVHIANNVSKNATGTPINVKIKLRHKDDKNNRDIFSMSKIENSNNANKLRLVNSDQTITSFNLLMDSDINKKSSKKSQNKILHLFKPGACLRNQNKDDDYTYMPESNKNKEYNASKTEDKDEKEKFGLMKNYIIEDEPFDDPVRRPKMFLGKCKPGGCLDPPFDEDKYSYEPVKMNQPVKEQKYSTQKPSDVVQNEILNNTKSEKIYLRSASKRQDSYLDKDIKAGSLITYPPNVLCNQPGSQKDSVEIPYKAKKQALPPNTNEYLQAFYIPPKSKETSISSKTIDIVENENVVVQNQNQTLKSLSKDSIMPTIGGPAAPVLPDTITLSTIESNLKNSQNNMAEQKMNNNKEKISCNEINEAPVILASPLIEEKRSDNMVKCDNDNLSYLQIVSLPSAENFEEFPTSMAPFIKKSQDKEIKHGDEIFWKDKDLVKNKDIIVIAPIKKSTDTNNSIESKSEINSTISKNKNSESLIDDKNMEILKLNPLKQEPEERMEITKNNSQIDYFIPPDDLKLKRTSSIKPNKPPETLDQESFKIEKLNAPDDLSFTLNTEDLTLAKAANDSHATIDTNAEQRLDKEYSTILRTNQSPQVLFDSQQELIKKVSSHIENKEFTNDEINIQKIPNQNNLHNESKSDVFSRLSGKTSISSSTKQLQKEVQQKISSSSNVVLSQSLKSKSDNGSIYKQDSKLIFAKTSTYNINNFRDDINTITKGDESVESTDFYEKKIFNDDTTKVRNEYIDNNYQEIGDNNLFNDPKDILNITTVSTIDDIDRQNIPSSYNDSHKEYLETVKIYSAADQTLKAAESIQINASNLTTNYIQKPNKDTVHQRDDEQYTATNGISRSTDKDLIIIKQKRLSKENVPDIKKREGKKEQLPYHQAQRKSATSSKHANTKTMPTKLSNNNKFENNLIHLDFALHLSEDGNETVLKTFDSECLPESSSKTPILFKYTIKANENKIKIPVNANTNIVLEINNNSLKAKKYTKGISNGLSSPNENKETNAHTLSKMNIMLQETITSIYEQNLVPVETMIRELKEDVEALVQNQKNIKQMLKASKNKAKHITSNRRCGCYRK